jgi:hypothetical protein
MLRSLGVSLILVLTLSSCDLGGSVVLQSNQRDISAVSNNVTESKTLGETEDSSRGIDRSKEVIEWFQGCLTGMRGGKLRLSESMIFDDGSGEGRKIIKRLTASEINGLKEYTFEVEYSFKKSFLSKVTRLTEDKYGTIGITTYESYDSYVSDKYSGQGLFEKVDCN